MALSGHDSAFNGTSHKWWYKHSILVLSTFLNICGVCTCLYTHCFLTVKATVLLRLTYTAIFSTFTCTTIWIHKYCCNETVQLSSVIYYKLTEFVQLFTANKVHLDHMFLNIKRNMGLSISTKHFQRE